MLLKESAVNSNIFYIYATAFLLYLVGLLTALAFYFWRSRRLIHTVDTINGLLEQIQNGNFKARYTPDSPNELKLIIDSVNYIAEMLEERMEREYQMAVEQKTFQFKALQAQINPHFLFNTLNSFIALNQMSMRGELESAIYSLTRMLRYSLGEGSTSTVAQELEFLENYCMLQKLSLIHICPVSTRSKTMFTCHRGFALENCCSKNTSVSSKGVSRLRWRLHSSALRSSSQTP